MCWIFKDASNYKNQNEIHQAQIWKINFLHKFPKKNKECVKKGKVFSLHKSAMPTQLEDALNMFWVFYESRESIDLMAKDSILLKKRNMLLGETLKGVELTVMAQCNPNIEGFQNLGTCMVLTH